MKRTILGALLVISGALNAGGVMAAQPVAIDLVSVEIPPTSSLDETVTVEFSLPGHAAAVDGRLLFDTKSAEIVGVAAVGGGVTLAPQEIDGGMYFGAYNLPARGGQTRLSVVIAPIAVGALEVRLVIDAAANARGQRLSVRSGSVIGATRIDAGTRRLAAPIAAGRHAPVRAAGLTRDLVPDGVLGRMDVDLVRAGWELARSNGQPCADVDPSSDANGDGCIDIVDVQAVVAAQGTRSSFRLTPTSDTHSLLGADDRSSTAPDRTTGSADASRVAAAVNPPFVVTSTMDTKDDNNGDGLCADSQGRCTLRAAITESNWQQGDNRIEFRLNGTVPVVIQLSGTPMSLVQDRSGALVIDGYSQPGSRVNTAASGSNAIMGVELRGTQAQPRGNALRLMSANNVVRGLSFRNFYRPIVVDGPNAQGNFVVGNWFGFSRTGEPDDYRGHYAIKLNMGASNNHIGTAALADRNVIGSYTHAIDLYGPNTNFNALQNNLLCTTPSGNVTAWCATGIDTNFGPKHNLTGGTAGEGNVIGRTRLNGVEISHGWNPDGADVDDTWHNDHNAVIGNWIGFRGDGRYHADFRSGQNDPNSNDSNGVNVYDGSNFNLIEGNWVASVWDGINTMSPNSTGNIIRNNIIGESPRGERAPLNRYGINVRNSTKTHFIEGNIIRNTGSHAIALTQKDVIWVRISRNIVTDTNAAAIFLAVDPRNSSRGANALLAAPLISSATTARVRGSGQPGATVEVYRASRNAGEQGLPSEYLGSAVVGSDGTWEAVVTVPTGSRVTALQINTANNTSRLANNVTVTQDQTPSGQTAVDAFGRTQVDGWGLADVGGAYTLQGNATNFDVAAGVGTIRLGAAGNSSSALLNGATAHDVDLSLRVAANKVAAGGPYVVYAVARRNATDEYRARLIFNGDGTLSVNASVLVAGKETSLAAPVVVPGLTQGAGKFIRLRARVTGADPTTIEIKAWADGTAEPSSWLVTTTSSQAGLQAQGAHGLRVWLNGKVSNAPVTFSFDDYIVTPVP